MPGNIFRRRWLKKNDLISNGAKYRNERVAGHLNEVGNQRWTVGLAGLYSIFNHTLELFPRIPEVGLLNECHVTRSSPEVKGSFNLILDQTGSKNQTKTFKPRVLQ